MAKTIIVYGFGPGISSAVAEKFGAEGFSVALVARNGERLAEGVKALEAKGVRAAAFPADVGDAAAIPALVEKIRSTLGPIGVMHWNAYSSGAGDLLTATPTDLANNVGIATSSLLAAIQSALPDLKAAKGSVLATNGGLGYFDPNVDAMGVSWGAMGLSIANSAKHKMVSLLNLKLKPENVYVGEVVVLGLVKGTAFDNGSATIEPSDIANKFWALHTGRDQVSVQAG
jgi:NAD(P)-dependent dehydrogenase (short-subunit alcohol dehydrogenase family)